MEQGFLWYLQIKSILFPSLRMIQNVQKIERDHFNKLPIDSSSINLDIAKHWSHLSYHAEIACFVVALTWGMYSKHSCNQQLSSNSFIMEEEAMVLRAISSPKYKTVSF